MDGRPAVSQCRLGTAQRITSGEVLHKHIVWLSKRRSQGFKDSNDGVKPIHFELTPGAANAAGINFTLAMSESLALDNVLINAVNPGPVDTDRWWGLVRTMSREKGISEDEAQARAIRSIPMGRLCTSEEVADMVVFLASERASFVTGASISMDGGQRKAIMDA